MPEAEGKLTCLRVAPNAPARSPGEDGWLKGKTYLCKQLALNKTFAPVKRCFSTFLQPLNFTSTKLSWSWPTAQMIEENYIWKSVGRIFTPRIHGFCILARKNALPPAAIQRMSLTGTREEIIAPLKQLEAVGLTQFAISPPWGYVEESIVEFAREVIANYGAASTRTG